MHVAVTGAAGFVGSHAVAHLLNEGHSVIATDLEPDPRRLANVAGVAKYVSGPLALVVDEVLSGADAVWHFAANADIPLGARDTRVDIENSTLLTHRVLESMRSQRVKSIVFPSTSSVYGNSALGPVSEAYGPLLPASLYGAGKLASEGLVSAYAQMFGVNASIFRLGNVVGGRMGRGIVRDFVQKLGKVPHELHILGSGRQRKSYVLVEDVVRGMLLLSQMDAQESAPVHLYNLAAGGSLDVEGVASAVARAMGLPTPALIGVEGLSWAGDQPIIELDIALARSAGWEPSPGGATSAVTKAAERLFAEFKASEIRG